MDIKEVAKLCIENSKETIVKVKDLFIEFKTLILTFVDENAKVIVALKDEKEFLKLLVQVGDELYHGNIITERFDSLVFSFVLSKVDKLFLDRIFGGDWFVKLQLRAKKILGT